MSTPPSGPPTGGPGPAPGTYPAPSPYPAPAAYPAPAVYPANTGYQAPAAYQPPAAGPAPEAYRPPASATPPAWQAPEPRPRVQGPGAVTVGVVLALCLFTAAALLLAERNGAFDGGTGLVIAGAALAILGLGVLVSGVRGRRSGVLGGLAILVALLAVPVALVSTAAPHWSRIVASGGTVVAGDVTWAPQTVAEAEAGYSFGVGEARIDLTAVPLEGAVPDPVTVAIEAGAGSTTVVVPSGVPLEVRTRLGAGEITSVVAGDWTTSLGSSAQNAPVEESQAEGGLTRTQLSGTNLDLTLRSPTTGDLRLVVTIDAGLGDVTIQESLR